MIRSSAAQVRPDYDVIYEEFGLSFGDEEVQSLIKRVISEINEKLPIYKRIRSIAVRKDEFIKTTTKKIQRHKNVLRPERRNKLPKGSKPYKAAFYLQISSAVSSPNL